MVIRTLTLSKLRSHPKVADCVALICLTVGSDSGYWALGSGGDRGTL